MESVKRRNSRYTVAVKQTLAYFGHATNAEITDDLRRSYPHLSDTTVHRITQRLLEDGEIQLAPYAPDGSMVFDINTSLHDHFQCVGCDELVDISVPLDCRKTIKKVIGNDRLIGSLNISGQCGSCINNEEGI